VRASRKKVSFAPTGLHKKERGIAAVRVPRTHVLGYHLAPRSGLKHLPPELRITGKHGDATRGIIWVASLTRHGRVRASRKKVSFAPTGLHKKERGIAAVRVPRTHVLGYHLAPRSGLKQLPPEFRITGKHGDATRGIIWVASLTRQIRQRRGRLSPQRGNCRELTAPPQRGGGM